jgi:hypothetical protein
MVQVGNRTDIDVVMSWVARAMIGPDAPGYEEVAAHGFPQCPRLARVLTARTVHALSLQAVVHSSHTAACAPCVLQVGAVLQTVMDKFGRPTVAVPQSAPPRPLQLRGAKALRNGGTDALCAPFLASNATQWGASELLDSSEQPRLTHSACTLHCSRALFSHGSHRARTLHAIPCTLLTVACALCCVCDVGGQMGRLLGAQLAPFFPDGWVPLAHTPPRPPWRPVPISR